MRRHLRSKAAVISLILLSLGAAWLLTPLSQWADFETLAAWAQSIRGNPAAPYLIVVLYSLGGIAFFPVTLMTVVTVFTFGPSVGGLYSLVGWLLSAALGYGLGRLLCRDLIKGLTGSCFHRLARQAERKGFMAVLVMRLLPIAPFTAVNLFIGASGIAFVHFILGSLAGRIPGLLALTVFGYQLESTLAAPAMEKVLLLAFAPGLLLLSYLWFARRLGNDKDTVPGTPIA